MIRLLLIRVIINRGFFCIISIISTHDFVVEGLELILDDMLDIEMNSSGESFDNSMKKFSMNSVEDFFINLHLDHQFHDDDQ